MRWIALLLAVSLSGCVTASVAVQHEGIEVAASRNGSGAVDVQVKVVR